jgi:hypothetical protein
LCGLSLSVLFHCSVPAKEAQDEQAAGSGNASDRDAGRDANTQEVGLPPQPDADTRNALCGAASCNPDDATEPCANNGTGAGGADGTAPRACRVVRSTTGTNGPVAACGVAGPRREQDPCRIQTDCGAGLACVGALGDSVGQCRPYCCYGQQSCGDGTYCTLVRAFEVIAGVDALRVPVCAVASNCRLLDPSACDPGLSCTFVDGATTCLPPGNGVDGAACPCAAGYVCLQSTSTCRRVCHERADEECGGGTCVSGGAAFPEGFGVCSK